MDEVYDRLVYKCNGCGFQYKEPLHCFHCGTPQCPACKRAGCIVSMVEMDRLVSHSKPLLASDLHRAVTVASKKPKGKRKAAKPKKSISQLMEEIGIS